MEIWLLGTASTLLSGVVGWLVTVILPKEWTKDRRWLYILTPAVLAVAGTTVYHLDEKKAIRDQALTTAGDSAKKPAGTSASPEPSLSGSPSPTPSSTVTLTPSLTPPDGDPTTDPTTVSTGPGWYRLTALEPVAKGWFSAQESVRIGRGGTAFPFSFVNKKPGSISSDDNDQTWTLNGECTKLKVTLGKDADSERAEGTGTFVIRIDEQEKVRYTANINTPAHTVTQDIGGHVRVTFVHYRKYYEAYNVWGSPEVYCERQPTSTAD